MEAPVLQGTSGIASSKVCRVGKRTETVSRQANRYRRQVEGPVLRLIAPPRGVELAHRAAMLRDRIFGYAWAPTYKQRGAFTLVPATVWTFTIDAGEGVRGSGDGAESAGLVDVNNIPASRRASWYAAVPAPRPATTPHRRACGGGPRQCQMIRFWKPESRPCPQPSMLCPPSG